MAILASTTGFTVLAGSTETSKLAVVGKVRANYRGAYDIMVRPKGARTEPERQSGRLAGNALSGVFGGITERQWQRIRQIKGVEVAAPIAMVGTVTNWNPVYVDLTDLVDPSLTEQVLRFNLTWHADRGLTRAPVDQPYLVYVTKRPLAFPTSDDDEATTVGRYTDGTMRVADACHTGRPAVYEIQDDGAARPLCLTGADPAGAADADEGSRVQYLRLLPDGTYQSLSDVLSSVKLRAQLPRRLRAVVRVPLALLLAGIDPAEEAALVGLDDAVTLGRYLDEREAELLGARSTDPRRGNRVPVLLASRLQLDERGVVDAVRVRTDGRPLAGRPAAVAGRVVAGPPVATARREVSADQAFREFASHDPSTASNPDFTKILMSNVYTAMRSGQPVYAEQPDGSLRAQPLPAAALGGRPAGGGDCPLVVPWLSRDTALRPLTVTCTGFNGITHVVGVYDSAKLRRFNDVVQAPLEGYYPPRAVGADAASRALLGEQPLLPNDNPANYLAPSPSLLTSIGVLRHLGAPEDLISAVRVRVSGITGFDPASRERVRLVAEQISISTGLDVDILLGASPGPQTIDLPPGRFGRPSLRINETWTQMGVGVAILRAVDRKSLALFLLVLVVCALFVTNATGSAVRHRRRELAVLACLGWPRWRLAASVLVEVGLLGLIAGGLSLAASYPVASLGGIQMSWSHARFAVPVAVILALGAAAVPALRAARSHPMESVRATASPVRGRPRRHGTMAALAWSNLTRVPGRTALAVAALTVSVAALTLLGAVKIVFDGTLIGTALGEAVSIRIRGVDLAAIIATAVLAAFAVADVLFLSIRERAHEFAALRATGWSTAAVGRLIGHEALAIGILAGLLGAGVGVAGAALLAGSVPTALLWLSTATALAGPVLAVLAATVPATLLRSQPATLLAEE